MTPHLPQTGFAPHFAGGVSSLPAAGLRFLQERASRAGNFFARGGLRKPQDLIGLLLGHGGARQAVVAEPAPRVAITIACACPSGRPAVELSV